MVQINKFINDLVDNIKSSQIYTFADDTKIVHPIGSSSDFCSLQGDLNAVIEWSTMNNMQLNKDKFELISHSVHNNIDSIETFNKLPFHSTYQAYNTGDDYVFPTTVVRDLGLFINSHLNWDDHISKLCKVGRQISGWILNVFFSRKSDVLITLFNSLVRSRLEYVCQVWDPIKINQIDALEDIQRRFTSKFTDSRNLNYWERLKKFKMMSLQRRREKLTILFVWRIKYNRAPNVINLIFVKTITRSSERALVKPMPKVGGSLLTLYENSFAVKAAKLWNKLPVKITKIDSFNAFREKLDTLLELYPDKPPVRGYYHTNSNSLLEYKTVNSV